MATKNLAMSSTCCESAVSSLQLPPSQPLRAAVAEEEEEYRAKSWAIQDCLRGNRNNEKEEVIDVWKLRELALSPGGLLEPSLRKRAWPILTGVTESVFAFHLTMQKDESNRSHLLHSAADSTCTTTTRTTTPLLSDLQTLQQDVRHTVWNVQEHFTQQLKQQQQKQQQTAHLQQPPRRRVNFSPVLDVENRPPSLNPNSYPSTHKGNNDKEEEADDDEKKIDTHDQISSYQHDDDEQHQLNENEEEDHSLTSRTTNHTAGEESIWSQSVMSCRRVRWRTASASEQKIVANVIAAVLRSSPPHHELYEDDRFHYYTGLHDLTALCMVNLESPSLSSLVLAKLATYHLRDATRKEKNILECALRHVFFPVLQIVDPVLFRAITETAQITNPSSFARGWVASWFASDVPDVAAASRLLDAFLVSHPTMPIYTAVALVTHHRHRILQVVQQEKTNKNIDSSYGPSQAVLYILRNLPVLFQDEDDEDDDVEYDEKNADDASSMVDSTTVPVTRAMAMTQIEKIIASTLEYMEQVPPDVLIPNKNDGTSISHDEQEDNNDPWRSLVPAVVMLQPAFQVAPAYFKAHTSWNEYALLQMAKRMRDRGEIFLPAPPSQCGCAWEDGTSYPLARIATGQKPIVDHGYGWNDPQVKSRIRLFIIAVIVIFLLAEPRETNSWRNASIQKNSNSRNKPSTPSRKNRFPSKLNVSGSLQMTSINRIKTQREMQQRKPISKETVSFSGTAGVSYSTSSPSLILTTVQEFVERESKDYSQTDTAFIQTPENPSSSHTKKKDGASRLRILIEKIQVRDFPTRLQEDTITAVPKTTVNTMEIISQEGKRIGTKAGKLLKVSIQCATPNLLVMNAVDTTTNARAAE